MVNVRWDSARMVKSPLQRQEAHARGSLVNREQGSVCQLPGELPNRGNNDGTKVCRQDIMGADLQHARAARLGSGEDRAKIEVVGEHDGVVGLCPLHDRPISGSWVAD
ncbi:MAG: hypothetical protein U0232_29170 [Thermomicrobiales bacterium]